MGKVERKVAILGTLSEASEPMRPSDIGEIIGETALQTGNLLTSMVKSGLVEKPDKKKSFYEITEKGRGYLENPPDEVEEEEHELSAEAKRVSEVQERSAGNIADETTVAIPSQADLFRDIGVRLRVGIGRGGRQEGTPLDAIIYYVQRTADLDNLTSVWNALTEMGVASDVKKRWIKLYAQNLPGKEISEELKEKLEGGMEAEKIKADTEGIPPKPKRFSVVGSEIIGDPEGDLNFKEALQLLAQQGGAPAEAVNSLATMVEAMKLGPEMATATLTAMIPLITKEPPQPSGEGALLDRLDSLGLLRKTGEEGRATQIETLEKLDQLGLLKKPGEGAEGSQIIVALQTEVKDLRESLQKQEMDTLKNVVVSLSNQLGELRKEIASGGKLEGRYALLEKTIGTIDNQLTGIRSDAKPLLSAIGGGGGKEPAPKSPEEKAKIARGLKQAVALEEEARKLEDELLFGKTPG